MRAFTITFVVAMLGAISLATMGAVWTVSQTRHTANAFGLVGDSAPVRSSYQRRPAFAAATMRIAPWEMAHDGASTVDDEGRDR